MPSFKRSNPQLFTLQKGTRIHLLDGMPAYEVNALDLNPSCPKLVLTYDNGDNLFSYCAPDGTLHTAQMPKEIVVAGHKPHFIGRHTECSTHIHVKPLSRDHVTIYFEPRRGQFVLTHNNLNAGEILNPAKVESSKPLDMRDSCPTFVGLSEPESHVPEDIPLLPGMTLKLCPSIPRYKVTSVIGGADPKLTMKIMGDPKGHVPVIEAAGATASIALGRNSNATYNLTPSDISRYHATIYWDSADHCFIYMPNPEARMPKVGLPDAFLADIADRCKQLTPDNPEQTAQQIVTIRALIRELHRDATHEEARTLERVLDLESPTMIGRAEDQIGAYTEKAQRGYRYWLQAYQILYKEDLSQEEDAKLGKAIGVLHMLEANRAELRDMESFAAFPADYATHHKSLLGTFKTTNYNQQMEALVTQQCAPLKKVPPETVYMVSGFKGHHVVTTIEADKAGYIISTYNAGAEAVPAPNQPDMVMAMKRQRLKPDMPIENMVRLMNERKLRPYMQGLPIQIAIEEALGPVESYRTASAQRKGNCTTRSTRELLKELLGERVFTDMHRYISNPAVCESKDIIQALQLRHDRLLACLPKDYPLPPLRPTDPSLCDDRPEPTLLLHPEIITKNAMSGVSPPC